jgi:hypothetical protein
VTLPELCDPNDLTPPEPSGPPVDILVAGTPGPLLRWTCDLLAGAAARRFASVLHVAIGGEETWIPPEEAGPVQVRLFFGDAVREPWASVIRDNRMPAIVVIDEPVWAWDALCRTGHLSGEAIRYLILIATTLGDLAGHPRVLTLTRAAWDDPAAVAARILEHAGFGVDVEGDTLPPLDETLDYGIPADIQPLVDGAVIPAFTYAMTGERVPVEWPRECLFWGDKMGEPAPRVVDLTGPARGLIYGPYYALAPGRWTMRATLAFSPDSCGTPMAMEFYGAAELGRFPFKVQQPGVFAASFAVTVLSPREPLEIRLVTERGAIEGSIGFDRITFTPEPG